MLLCIVSRSTLRTAYHVDYEGTYWRFYRYVPAVIIKNVALNRRRLLHIGRAAPSSEGAVVSSINTHTGHGSLLKLRQFHLPQFYPNILGRRGVPTLLGRYLRWISVLSRRVGTSELSKLLVLNETRDQYYKVKEKLDSKQISDSAC